MEVWVCAAETWCSCSSTLLTVVQLCLYNLILISFKRQKFSRDCGWKIRLMTTDRTGVFLQGATDKFPPGRLNREMFSLAQAGSHPTQAAAALAADRPSHLRLGRPPCRSSAMCSKEFLGNLESADPEPQTSLVPLVLSHLCRADESGKPVPLKWSRHLNHVTSERDTAINY